MDTREQKLVDIMFEIAMMAYSKDSNLKYFETREDYANWISKQLNECGFPGQPVGLRWHSLDKGD